MHERQWGIFEWATVLLILATLGFVLICYALGLG